ncbi:hypothetical protein O6H91_Y051400 [Diphasiastrum complanatum]|nr:hypothetical protein O6H91_Y051400 [Diphasiastrum complanatum]
MGESVHTPKATLLFFFVCLACFEFIAAAPTAFVGQVILSGSYSYYEIMIKLGTPPQVVTLALDTTIDITTVNTSFDPRKSSSYHSVAGFLSSDTVTLNPTDGFVPMAPVPLTGIQFVLNPKVDLLALGPGSLAFPAQVSTSSGVAKKFAYCLGQNSAPTPIFFGNTSYHFDSGLPPQSNGSPELDITPFLKFTDLKTPSYGKHGYAVQITSIAVDEANNGSVIDVSDVASIGTEAFYTSIVEPAYTQIRQAFLRTPAVGNFQKVNTIFGSLDLCFNFTGRTGDLRSAPVITFTFDGNTSVPVTSDNYLVQVDSTDIYCFGIVSAGPLKGNSVIGTFQQENNLVEFDLEKQRVGLTGSLIGFKSNCANFNFTGF